MRIPSIEKGESFADKALFGFIRVVSGHRAPDVIRTLRYRRALFGAPMRKAFQAILRGPSEWTVGERELFAAWIARQTECEF